MARIPNQNELTETLQSRRLPAVTNSATIQNLARDESEFGKFAGVAGEALNKFAVQKQNQEDTKNTQFAFAAWKENEFKYESDMLRAKGDLAVGSLARTKEWGDNKGATIGDAAQDIPDAILDEFGNDTGQDRMTHYEAEKPTQTPEYLKFKQRYDALPGRLQVAMDLLIEKRKPDMLRKAMAHETKERTAAVQRSSTRTISQSKIQAIHNYDNPRRLNEELIDISNAVEAVASLEGWNQEDTDAVVLGHVSEVHQTVISQFLAQNTDEGLLAAENYRDNHPGELTETANKAMIVAIRNKDIDMKSDVVSESILNGDKDWNYELSKVKDREVKKEARSKLYTQERLRTHGQAQMVKQQENTMHDFVVKAGKQYVDFGKLGPDLQPVWDALPFRTQVTLKKIHLENRSYVKPVSDHIHAASYENLSRMSWVDPDGFKATNFALKYYGVLKPSGIQHFQDLRTTMMKNDQSGSGQKDYMAMQFQHAGWTGEDHASRRGAARIEHQSALNGFKESHQGRNPSDLELQSMITETMGNYNFRRRLERENPSTATVTVPKAAAGVALSARSERALNIAGFFKGNKTFSGGFNGEGNRKTYRLAQTKIDVDIEGYKATHGGQISERREMAIVNRVANDLVYVDGVTDDFFGEGTPVLRASLPPGTPLDKIYVLVGPKGTDKVYYSQIHAASREDKKAMAIEIGRTGVPESTINLARIWMAKNEGAIKLSSIEISNPSGGATTTGRELTAASQGLSIEELNAMTPSIKKQHGPLAESAWEMLIENKSRNENHTRQMEKMDSAMKGLSNGR